MNIIKNKILVLMLGAFLLPSMAPAEDLTVLENFINNTKTIKSEFSQVIYDNFGIILQETSGQFVTKKPDMYFWKTTKPDLTVLVSDGKQVWHYDKELEQVTINSVKDSNFTPIVVLATNLKDLQEQFEITSETGVLDSFTKEADCADNAITCYRFTPKKNSMDFSSLIIKFKDNKLGQIVLHDQLQNITKIDFEKMVVNSQIENSTFSFSSPEGVDIVKNS